MNEQDHEAITGQISALFMTLTSVISALPPAVAAQAAVQLAHSQQMTQKEDLENEVPDGVGQSRDALIRPLLALLQGVARHG